MVVLPILHVVGFIMAFVAGGLLAGHLQTSGKGRRPEEAPAEAPKAGSSPGGIESYARDKGLVFGHEMKNYLCAIRGNAMLLRQGARGMEQDAIIDRIDRVLEKLENFEWKEQSAPDILTPRTQECVDLAHIARSCSRLHFTQAGVEFPCDNSEGMLYTLGDPQRLDQVFNNLYRNALEAGATRIVTRYRRIGNEVEVAIEDNGLGCPAETAKRIFEPFFSTKRGSRNCGLGLFIVQSIVENHRGRIRANSKNDRGDGESGLVVYLNFPIFSPNKVALETSATPALGEVRFPIASGA